MDLALFELMGSYFFSLYSHKKCYKKSRQKGLKKDRLVNTVYMNIRKLGINIIGPNIHVHCYIHGLGTL